MTLALRRPSVLPGFHLALGTTLLYLTLIVLIPLSAAFLRTFTLTWDQFIGIVTAPRVLASLRLSFGAAFLAAIVNAVFGLLLAWVLTRYRFPGAKIIDALVDLPFALPTAVAGIALTAVYAPNGWLGAPLATLGIKVAFTPLGVLVALIFIGLPFVVRTIQPVLEDMERELEEAARSLGANALADRSSRCILPTIMPALLTGFTLAFARAVGEYGSVIFIAGNMPMISEIAPLVIISKLEQYDYPGATALAVVMLLIVVRPAARDQPAAGLDAPSQRAGAGGLMSAVLDEVQPVATRRHATARPSSRRSDAGADHTADDGRARVRRRSRCCCRSPRCSCEAFRKGVEHYLTSIADPDALSAIRLTLTAAAIAVPANLVFGVAAAWAIAKYDFKGKSLLITP